MSDGLYRKRAQPRRNNQLYTHLFFWTPEEKAEVSVLAKKQTNGPMIAKPRNPARPGLGKLLYTVTRRSMVLDVIN